MAVDTIEDLGTILPACFHSVNLITPLAVGACWYMIGDQHMGDPASQRLDIEGVHGPFPC